MAVDNHWLFACQKQDNSIFAYQINHESKQALLAWRQGSRFDARNIELKEVTGLSTLNQNILMMNILDTDTLPDQYPFRQEDRYLLDGQGNTPLHRAVKGRDKKTVVQLLNARVDLGHTNFMDRTPLMLAIEYDDKDIVGTLIEYKADINQKMDVDSSQEIALKGDRPLSTDRWGQENTPFSVTPLALAAQKGLATIVKLLLDHKADLIKWMRRGFLQS